jgi:hypothetical protein
MAVSLNLDVISNRYDKFRIFLSTVEVSAVALDSVCIPTNPFDLLRADTFSNNKPSNELRRVIFVYGCVLKNRGAGRKDSEVCQR